MGTISNERKYSIINFEDTRDHLLSILRAKGGNLADFGESSYGRTIIEEFAGVSDLMASYAEASFENSFLESATNPSAIYAGARMLGYSPRRPVPAKAGIGIQTTNTGVYDTIRVFIPRGTTFSMGGSTLTAMDDMEFSYDRDLDVNRTGLMKQISGRAVVAEGVFKYTTLMSNATQNQTFIISDPTFSDYFGDGDPNYADDGNVAHRAEAFCTITSDATLVDNVDMSVVKDDKLYWRISRRGLIDPAKENTINDIDAFVQGQDNYTTNYSAYLNTANDGNVMLKFGDGLKSAIPYGTITVKYFSTSGEDGNQMNVAGTVLATTSSTIVITQEDGTESDITLNDLNIALTTDIRGGLNIESGDSIKTNAPMIYSTLDRLVNRMSYKLFLRRFADIKYATAYGEDILNTKLLNGSINVKYMNQIRFSALKDLYREKDGTYYPTSSDEYFLDGFKVNGLMYTWEYDYQDVDVTGNAYLGEREVLMKNVVNNLIATIGSTTNPFSAEDEVREFVGEYLQPLLPQYPLNYKVFSANLSPMDFVEDGSELYSIMVALNQRGMLTVSNGHHNYVYPSVHNMEIHMDVTLFKGNNFTNIKERIKNVIYKYLKDNTEFSTAIYRSRIESLVHTMTEVAGVEVTFHPIEDGYTNLDMRALLWLGDITYEFIVPGSLTMDEMPFYLRYEATEGLSTTRVTNEFVLTSQADMQGRLSTYYLYNVMPKVQNKTITDKDIDHYVAYVWEQVMQQIYTPIYNKMTNETNSGNLESASILFKLLETIKTWDMQGSALTFKDNDTISSLVEVNGSTLYEYMRYGMEYIKLIRNVLSYYVSSNLLDENGNITKYSNDNEIVQLTIPTAEINLTVAYDSSLLTAKDNY